MTHWIISANSEIYDHHASFEKYSYIDWKQTANYEVDDIVYIYSTQPVGRVQYKTRVVKTNMSFGEIRDDKEFWEDEEKYYQSKDGLYSRLKLIAFVDREELSLDYLLKNGLKGAPQKPTKLINEREELVYYLEKKFDEAEGKFSWIAFYEELADKLYEYRNRKHELFEIIKELREEYVFFNYLNFENNEWWGPRNYIIDPFSVFAVMNRGITDANRVKIAEIYKETFELNAAVPNDFQGIPILNNMQSFFRDTSEDSLWKLFKKALKYAETKEITDELVHSYDAARKIKGNGMAMITIALFWIRPNVFMPLDRNSLKYIVEKYKIEVPSTKSDGATYFKFLNELASVSNNHSFYKISYDAWLYNRKEGELIHPSNLTKEDWLELINNPEVFTRNALITMKAFMHHDNKATCTQLENKFGRVKNFYNSNVYSIGKRVSKATGININDEDGKERWWKYVLIGEDTPEGVPGSFYWQLRPELAAALDETDLSNYPLYEKSESEVPEFRKISADDSAFIDFRERHLKELDEFEKFIDITSREDKNVIKASNKASSYRGYLIRLGIIIEEFYQININTLYDRKIFEKMNSLRTEYSTEFKKYNKDESRFPNATINSYELFLEQRTIYTSEDFLSEVYMSEENYHTIEYLLKEKKNLILQGAPGVGKTYSAKRLAYSMMGEVDDSRIEFIQFHQNYSYEDFVMGYQPDGEGFSLKNGLFIDFCEKAREDVEEKDYFLIIDEINRGNISKIFGELLMTIEKDYRGVNVTMPYSGQLFNVPENLYIIGMMNTADRSLALIDYALRRRFSFYEMIPGFQTNGFKKYQESIENETFNQIIERIEGLNIVIKQDPTLGRGFQIGHSYFTNQSKDSYTDGWLKRVIQYEIIPMLKEYWFDDDEKVLHQQNILMDVFEDEI